MSGQEITSAAEMLVGEAFYQSKPEKARLSAAPFRVGA
jgi:hypothetical protein